MALLRTSIITVLMLIIANTAFGFKNKRNEMSIIKKESLNQAFNHTLDMYEKDGKIIAKMDIPGIDAQDIHVQIEDGQLHVFGERRSKEEVNEENYYYKETEFGRFDRLVSLPADINEAEMKFEIKDGVLTVEIPKA